MSQSKGWVIVPRPLSHCRSALWARELTLTASVKNRTQTSSCRQVPSPKIGKEYIQQEKATVSYVVDPEVS